MSIFSEMNMMENEIYNMIHFVSKEMYLEWQAMFESIGDELMDVACEEALEIDEIYANDYTTLEQIYSCVTRWMDFIDKLSRVDYLEYTLLYYALSDMKDEIEFHWEEEC